MTIEETIKKAIEGGYNATWDSVCGAIVPKGDGSNFVGNEHPMLDPLFWQYLGKEMGWPSKNKTSFSDFLRGSGADIDGISFYGYKWEWCWHRFIDALAEGRTAKDFFRKLTR